MGFDQNVVTEAIGQGTHLPPDAPESVNAETKQPLSSRTLSGSIGNTGGLYVAGAVNRDAATLQNMGSAVYASNHVDTVNSPMNLVFHGATVHGMQGRVVPVSAASPVNTEGSVCYTKVVSVSPKQAQESFHLLPRTASMERMTLSRENTISSVEDLQRDKHLDGTRMASNVPQSSMTEILLMMQELRQDFTALKSRVNALPAGSIDSTPSGILEVVEAEKNERRREMGEVAAHVNVALAEIRTQTAALSDRLTTIGDTSDIVPYDEEPKQLEGIVNKLLQPERAARSAQIAMSLEAERAGRVQDLNNERDARAHEMHEVRLSIEALSEKLDGHSAKDAFFAQELEDERDAREKGNAELVMALEEIPWRTLEHCTSLEQRVSSQLQSVAPAQNQEATAVSGNVLKGANEELLRRLAAVEALCNEGQRELQASIVDLQVIVAGHQEHVRLAAFEALGSIDTLHRDVEVLQASAVTTAELLLEAQQELRKVQQCSDSDMEAPHRYHAGLVESHKVQLDDLEAAHSRHANTVELHKTQLGQLEVAHAGHASIVESHGSKLSCLEAAHGHHATMIESYDARLSELVTAHERQLSALETHRDQLRHLEAAHGHATAFVESHVDQLSSLKDRHAIETELHKQQISELQAAQSQHASSLERLQHQVNSVQNFEQLVGGLSVDMDVMRRRQQDSNSSPHEGHEITNSFVEQMALIKGLCSKINELEVSSAERAELDKSWKARYQELHQAHTARAGALEDSHVQHRGDLETLLGQVESWRSLDERMGCLQSDMEALKQRLPVGRLKDHSVMNYWIAKESDLQVMQVEKTDCKEAGTAERSARGQMARKQVAESKEKACGSEPASIEIEAAATRIQCSARMLKELLGAWRNGAVERANNERAAAATRIQRSARGQLARRQVTERKEAMAANIQLVTSELQASEVDSVIEHQETGLSSAISERQVTGSDEQSATGKHQEQRSWWRRLTIGGPPHAPISISPHATPLQFTILGAKGLRVADWTHGEGKSDPYCVCELKGRSKASKTQTQVIYHYLDPIWNHEATFNDYVVGDSLVFKIYDVDYIHLGSLVLPSEKFHPHGFEGELPLESAGEDSTAVLRLKIEAPLESMLALRSQ